MPDRSPLTTNETDSAMRRAYLHIKTRLLDGRFPGGTLLSENELARELGLSRTPVRQAFVHLQAEGLITLYPKRGGLVVPITPDEAEDVLEARLLIEPHCARQTAGPNPTLHTELTAAIDDQHASLHTHGEGFVLADRRFHRAIIAATGNAILVRQYDNLRDRHQRIVAAATAGDPARIQRFITEHRQIATAIHTGDGDQAAALMTTHIRAAHALARRRSTDTTLLTEP